ncbi:hypothetical protein COCNU_10G003650 [Cocos nucifera]|uniref:Homeobox domain-containing protein n=1 Tax=Cocos nucifera TaxID=13894 RepID=A0A8K0ILP3_COCNU|nr:hypothetical protein COCNU_10G003650 [Cocos nucifera]
MMVEKEDLGLSLSLSSPETRFPLQLNLMPSCSSSSPSPPPPPPPFLLHSKSSWSDLLSPSSERRTEGALLRGIDVNRAPATERESEEEAGASSPNSTVSSVSGKRGDREVPGSEEHEAERACSRGISDEEDGEGSRKKLRLSKDQSAILEESFKEHNTLNPKQKLALAKQLNLRPRQVEVWFQNRRARYEAETDRVVLDEGVSDEVEADGGGLRVPQEMLRESHRRKSKASEGSPGAESSEAIASVLHAHDPSHHPHHVSFMRARLQLHQYRHGRFRSFHGAAAGRPPSSPPPPPPGPYRPCPSSDSLGPDSASSVLSRCHSAAHLKLKTEITSMAAMVSVYFGADRFCCRFGGIR